MIKKILYDWGDFNQWLFHAINQFHTNWLDHLMSFGSLLGEHQSFALYWAASALSAIYITRKSRGMQEIDCQRVRNWLEALAVLSVAYVLNSLLINWLKDFFALPRPLAALPTDSVIIVGMIPQSFSFPSGHAAFAMLLLLSFWPVFNWAGRSSMILLALWIGLSRISVGAHFPVDVVAGYLCGGFIVTSIRWIIRKINKNYN